MSEANTQDMRVGRCWIEEGGWRPSVVCQVDWHGRTEELSVESILNEVNKTAVFADGYAKAAQAMAKGKR